MPIYHNGAMVGMYDAVRDAEYQQKLDVKAGEILDDKESISLADLKKNSLFAQAYKELNAKGKARIDQIANMEGDAQNVSERELKVILTAMDANLQDWEYRILQDACFEAGITARIGTHTLRKTFGYHFYQKHKDIGLLQYLFNHSSQRITLLIGITQELIDSKLRSFAL